MGSLPNVLTLGNKQWVLWLSKFPCKLSSQWLFALISKVGLPSHDAARRIGGLSSEVIVAQGILNAVSCCAGTTKRDASAQAAPVADRPDRRATISVKCKTDEF